MRGRAPGGVSGAKGLHKLFIRDAGLLENAGQGSYLELPMVRYHAAGGTTAHEDMATPLAYHLKAKTLQSSDSLGT